MMRPSEFSFRTRQASLETLAREQFDLLVIGGGITGAGILREAALRGLKACLIESRDFASGTSSRSSKLVHGGLRYLQHGDVALVMEAANERRVLRHIAPYLARPIKMIVPVHGRAGYATIRAGLWTFDRMARVEKDERKEMLGSEDTQKLEPLLRGDKIYGSGVYYECLTDDARLVLANLRSAVAFGSTAVNYTSVTSFETANGKLTAAVVKDELSGDSFSVRAKLIVNAAGPWVDDVRLLQGEGEKPKLHLTKGIHLVIRRDRLPISQVLVMTAKDKRSIFAVPRGPVVYLGTTDTNYEGPLDEPAVTEEDAQYLLEATNRYFNVDPITLTDVVGAWAGLRPLIHEEGKKPSDISRKDEIMTSPFGLLSIAGGKLTAYRKMAERIVTLVATQLGGASKFEAKGKSETELLVGGATGEDLEAFSARLKQRWPLVAPEIVDRLVALYGSDGERIVEDIAADPTLGELCDRAAAVTRAEVEFGVREEMALTLTDFVERRARLFLWSPDNGLNAAPSVAKIMARMLGWSAQRVDEEIARYRDHVAAVKSFTHPPTEMIEAQAAHA